MVLEVITTFCMVIIIYNVFNIKYIKEIYNSHLLIGSIYALVFMYLLVICLIADVKVLIAESLLFVFMNLHIMWLIYTKK
jgi:hypothetical protein